ncbi:MAG TPA: tyrosine--tRNA ligase [Candidatus Acidoferrales bacterium]|nr:tyrosine--tRNA ligase [Candidatus Acidoferrales bacterium]
MNAPSRFPPVDEQLAYLAKGAAEILPQAEFEAKLEHSAKTGRPLRAYLGVDPTAPDLHLGHTVVLRKLKHFQDMGHTAVFLIGDFSAMIGDPTGQSETRPPLSRAEVDANARTYLEQVFKILDRQKTEIRYNSEWLAKLGAEEIVRLCSHYPLARMLEREDFRSRLEAGGSWKRQQSSLQLSCVDSPRLPQPDSTLPSARKLRAVATPQSIAIHELLYPLLTAYDAVMLKSDVELGATEQKFNLLVHRDIQREYGLPGQAILTMPILVGLDDQRKMSKSYGNYVGITEPPTEMFGKLMSISDELMWSYWELLTDVASDGVRRMRQQVAAGGLHPMDAKMGLATKIVADFHGEPAAREASEQFRRVFRERREPDQAPERRVARGEPRRLVALLVDLGLAGSRSEAERLVKQGGVELDGARVEDIRLEIDLSRAGTRLLRAGKKKFLRLTVE